MNIVVKLPNEINEKILAFPFLQLLENVLKDIALADPDDDTYQIHLISTNNGIDVLNLLPIEAFYHEIEEEDLKSVFTVHRACANLTINNRIDAFISLTPGFIDASIGKNIKAFEKIGFALGRNKWVLTKAIPHPGKVHKSDELIPLLKGVRNLNFEVPNVYARNLEPVFADWSENPYTVIDLDLIDNELNPEWLDFFDLQVNKRFVLTCSKLKDFEQNLLINEFIKKLPSKNTYKFFKYDSNIELAKLLSYAMNFVTNDTHLMTLGSFCGTLVHFINDNVDLKLISTKYFKGEVVSIPYQSDSLNNVFDEVIGYIESQTQPNEEESEEENKEEISEKNLTPEPQ